MDYLEGIRREVIEGRAAAAKTKMTEALDAGMAPEVLLNEGLISALTEVGKLYEEGEIFVPEMLVASRAMQAALGVLHPYLVAQGTEPRGRVVIGTVKGDLHDIGKNLVAMMLQGSGYEIVDLGVDVTPDKFVDAIRDGGANIVAMSALLTTTMVNMQPTIVAITEAGLREQVSIVIGGAPITKAYSDEIGADGYAPDASSVVRLVEEILSA